jgi:plasmid replication initiation protein
MIRPSRLMHATPYEILRFIGRGVSLRDYGPMPSLTGLPSRS